MPGKDFEQQVRETLGPWRIEPSEGIWGRLEESLARKKKRRRAFYFFLLAGLLAGGALLIPEKDLDGPDHAAPTTISSAQKPAPVEPARDIAGQEVGTTNPAAPSIPSATIGPELTAPSGIKSQAATDPSASTNPSATIHSLHVKAGNHEGETPVAGKTGLSRTTNLDTAQQASRMPGRSNATGDFAGEADRRRLAMEGSRAKDKQPGDDRPMPIAENSRSSFGHLAYISPFPAVDTVVARPLGIRATAATLPSAGPGQVEKYTPKKQWSFGISAGAGRAAFTEGIGLPQVKSADLNAGPSTGSGIPPQGPAYDYRQDPSTGWEIGGWMRLQLSRKWSFTAGLSFIQFSTRTPVGQSLGDSSRSYYNGYTSQVSTNSFSAGSQSEYRNRYHLLQLPLMAEWQLTPGRKLPVIWTMGLAPGYLLSSNALVRDSAQALYSHPDNQRRFQLGFRTGLRFRLMPSSEHPLDIGPVLQYQLNEVFVDGIRDNGHLYYLGIEARFPLFFLSRVQR